MNRYSMRFLLMSCFIIYGCVSTHVPLREAAPEHFVGVISTHDPEILDVSQYLTGWNTGKTGPRRQVFLRVTKKGFKYGETADWAVIVRGDESRMTPGSTVDVADGAVSIHIYRFHSIDLTKCCSNTLPYEEFDIAESSYFGTKGRISFLSKDQANFRVTFRKEKTTNSRELIGEPVRVTGCWNIAGEGQKSGCRLGEN